MDRRRRPRLASVAQEDFPVANPHIMVHSMLVSAPNHRARSLPILFIPAARWTTRLLRGTSMVELSHSSTDKCPIHGW